ncbi:MAG: outer membrane protein assembly factor BamD [Planctomycetaceae bacterium]|nr:outer membrane protein assembly factor BamD [Planctomycetaceae bacterium]
MSMARSRVWLPLCLVAALAGCNSLPTATSPSETQWRGQAQDSATGAASQGYDPWLWNSVGGRKGATGGRDESSAASPGSATASNTPETAGPLVPGPSSVSKWHGTASSTTGTTIIPADAPPVPPPTIPAELPSATDGVSIKDIKPEDPQKKKGFEWSDLAPENVYKNMKKAAGYGPNEKIARAAKAEGEALFREKKFKEAGAKFALAAARWPDTPLEEDSLFMEAESEFFSDQYPKAHDTYGGLLKKYSNTRHMDAVCSHEFALGRYWEQLYVAHPVWPIVPNVTDNSKPLFDTFGYAVQAYERIRQHDPTGPLADASLMALGNAYFRRGHYEEAAYQYDLLRKDYPKSKYQMNAHLLGLQAKIRVYQGTAYDDTPLKDAGKIADQALTQFGNKLGDERARVERVQLQIIEEKANREYTIARYYDQHAYYGAAKIYYKSLIENYPTTEKAKEARARMEQIRNEPDEPVNHFKWLTNAFDSKKK